MPGATDVTFHAGSALRPSSRTWIAWSASFAFHAALTGGIALVLHARSHEAPEPLALAAPASMTAVDLPSMSETPAITLEGDPKNVTPDVRDPLGKLPPTLGGEANARADTGQAGRGGQTQVAAPAINLEARDEHVHLSPDPIDRLDRDQLQRLKTANERTAWEDRRATTHPTELSFMASGQGERAERRAPAATDPSRGLARADDASRPGGVVGGNSAEPAEDEATRELRERERAAIARGEVTSAAGLGVTNGQLGVDHRASADVTHARPDVAMGPTTIPARTVARPNDTVDSDQEVATALQSLVHASTAGGALGAGEGGSDGAKASAPGAGGTRGEGSRAHPLGDGAGDWFDIDTSDPRLLPYFRKLHARIDPLVEHAFPASAVLELKQGTVILEFVIHADGSATVEWPPRRPSGVPEFDKNCADAIRKAAPFDPPPAAILGANARELRVRAPFAETRRW